MNTRKYLLTAIAMACATLAGTSHAAVTVEQLQQALDDARQATARAQAAAEKAEAALNQLRAQAQAQGQAPTLATVRPQTPAAAPIASDPDGLAITGLVDLGVRKTTNTDSTKSSTAVANNNTATSLVYIEGKKTFKDNVKASFLLEIDMNPTQSSTANGSASSNAYQGTPFNGEQYLAFEGDFGKVQLGTPNAAMLTAGVTAQPFGTALGGGYSSTFGRFGTASVSGINQYIGGPSSGGRIIRHEKTMMYTTPDFNGFSASGEYAFGNDKSATVTSNTNAYKAVSLRYNKGPLSAMYVYAGENAGNLGAAGATATIGATPGVTLPVNTNVTWNFLAANYKIGDATVYGGYSRTKQDAPTPLENAHSWNVAGKYDINSQWSLLGNYLVRSTDLANVSNAKLIGLGTNYAYDKSVNIYTRYESQRFDTNGTATAATQNLLSLGAVYKF